MSKYLPKLLLGQRVTLEWSIFFFFRWLGWSRRKAAKQRFIAKNPEQFVKLRKSYLKRARRKNPEKWRGKEKADNQKRREKKLVYMKKYEPRSAILAKLRRQKNPEKHRLQRNLKYRNNPQYRIKTCLSTRLRNFILKKGRRTMDYVGCSASDLMLFLQAQFTKGMAWNNYGEWEIDHRIPCSSFDLTNPDHIRRCFHFSNLQPLWKVENRIKQDKIGPHHGNQQHQLGI